MLFILVMDMLEHMFSKAAEEEMVLHQVWMMWSYSYI
jgi:hypothetical protein